MKGVTEGRIVHYVLPDGNAKGEHRPAIIVRVWNQSAVDEPDYAVCNLQVFTDSTNDYPDNGSGTMWVTSAQYDDSKQDGSWHWIEPA
jgi:hypothetical protein